MREIDLIKEGIDLLHARAFSAISCHRANDQLSMIAINQLATIFPIFFMRLIFHGVHLLRHTVHNALVTKGVCQHFFAGDTVEGRNNQRIVAKLTFNQGQYVIELIKLGTDDDQVGGRGDGVGRDIVEC